MNCQLLPPQCADESCPLHYYCSRVATYAVKSEFSNEDDPVDIMLIGEHARASDIQSRFPFSGAEGKILRQLLSEIAEGKNIALTYAVRGWPVEPSSIGPAFQSRSIVSLPTARLESFKTKSLINHPEKRNIISHCLPYLNVDIQRLKPRLLVVMGNVVLEALFPRESRSITRLSDSVLSYYGIPTRFISSPSAILKNPSIRNGWEKQLKAIITGEKIERDTTIGNYNLITKLPEAIEYIAELKHTTRPVSIDTETSSLNKRYGNTLGTIQLAETGSSAVVIPYLHPETPFGPDDIQILNKHLYSLFYDPSQIKYWICHNAKFECNIFRTAVGTPLLSAPIFDTMAGAFLLDENRTSRAADFKYGIYALKQLALDYLNFDGYDKGILAVRDEGNLFELPINDVASYGGLDAYITFRLHEAELEEAERQNYSFPFKNLMFALYSPMTLLFSDIEHNGSPVNLKHLRNLITRDSPLLKRIGEIYSNLKETPEIQRANDIILQKQYPPNHRVTPLTKKPWVFDFAKKGHPQALFFDVLRLRPRAEPGKSGLYSVDEEWQKTYENHPIVKEFVEWSLMRKMFDSFANQLYNYVDPAGTNIDCNTDCKIRPGYLISSVVTGRIACRDPNLQSCIHGDTRVFSTDPNIKTAKELPKEGKIYNGVTFENYYEFFSQKERLFKITTALGYVLRVSKGHTHWAIEKNGNIEEKETWELEVGDHLPISINPWLEKIKDQSLAKEYNGLGKLWGYLSSDSLTTKTDNCFEFIGDRRLVTEFKDLISDQIADQPIMKKCKEGWVLQFRSPAIRRRLRLAGLLSEKKYVPTLAFRSGPDFAEQFFKAISAANKFKYATNFAFSTSNEEIFHDVRLLLLGSGIPTASYHRDELYNLEIHGNYWFNTKPMSRSIYATIPNAKTFLEKLPAKDLFELDKIPSPKHVPIDWVLSNPEIIKIIKANNGHMLDWTLDVIEKYEDILILPIKSIEDMGEHEVYDITTEKSGIFWADGFLTHNCPRPENEAKKAIKDIFQAMPGFVMVQADAKANEMRWAGLVSQDDKMAESFLKGKRYTDEYRKKPDPEKLRLAELFGDIHKQNASKAFKKPLHEITKDERQKSKGISFGVLYDSSHKSISELYSIPLDIVEQMFHNFYSEYNDIYRWKYDVKNYAKQHSYVESPHGRRRRLPIFDLYKNEYGYFREDAVPNDQRGAIAEALRQASNSVIQGIASDAMMIGSFLFAAYIRKHKKPWYIQNVVHDSLLYQCPLEDLEEAVQQTEYWLTQGIMDYMTNAFEINFILPLEIDIELGLTWGGLKRWKGDPQGLYDLKTWVIEERKRMDEEEKKKLEEKKLGVV